MIPETLRPEERQALHMAVMGQSDKEIAVALRAAVSTVRGWKYKALDKLNLNMPRLHALVWDASGLKPEDFERLSTGEK